MKRRRILQSAPTYPRAIRSRRYYADLAQLDHDAAVERERKARATEAALPAPAGADQPRDTTK